MSILSLIYRTLDMTKWGAGKGSNLNAGEVDSNFWQIQEAIDNLAENPAQPVQISNITTNTADNTFSVVMNDATVYGPFTLPVATLEFTGPFEGPHDYTKGDLFTADDGLYITRKSFTSGPTFDPELGDGSGHYAVLLLPYQTKVRIGWYWPTHPGAGLESTDSMFTYLCADRMRLPANLPGSVGHIKIPGADMSYPIWKNGTEIGRVEIDSGNDVEFTFATDVDFEIGDMIELGQPATFAPDARGLMVTLIATLLGNEVDSSS